jgi:hypothetical protein
MEKSVAQLSPEGQKSFDPLASVDMLRYDLENFGQVLPETRERVCDEELSYLAEGVDRAAGTTFVLRRNEDGGLAYFDRGNWRPYTGMLMTGMEVSEREAEADPRRTFLADWAARDMQKGLQMGRLKPGEQMTWHNSYPHELERVYGKKFLQEECGLVPDRQMGFLYRASCQMDGTVVLESHTVDRSDADSFSAVEARTAQEPNVTMEGMLEIYDGALAQKHGGDFYAGRRDAEQNAWNFIRAQHDLVNYFLNGLELIARRPLPREQLEDTAKRHVYGVWAAFKKRMDGEVPVMQAKVGRNISPGEIIMHQIRLEQEIRGAFQDFASKGHVLVGCGGAIKMLLNEQDIMNADSEDVFSAAFGKKKEDEDKYGSLTFKCPKGHRNRRPRNELIPNCQKCGISVAC